MQRAVILPEDTVQPAMFNASALRVVKIVDALKLEELDDDDDEYADIMDDMKEEMGKFGKVVSVHIPEVLDRGRALPPPGWWLSLKTQQQRWRHGMHYGKS